MLWTNSGHVESRTIDLLVCMVFLRAGRKLVFSRHLNCREYQRRNKEQDMTHGTHRSGLHQFEMGSRIFEKVKTMTALILPAPSFLKNLNLT